MSKSEIETLRHLIQKYNIKAIKITETEDKTKTIFINYES